MRRAKLGVLVVALGMATFAAAWWIHRPRLVSLGEGPVQPLGISVGAEIPARFGWRSTISIGGVSPIHLFFRLPNPRKIRTASGYEWGQSNTPPPGLISARLVLPNGSTAPIDLQRDEDRLLVALRGDTPASLNRFDVEIFVPGRPTSKFRIDNAGTAAATFDVDRRVTRQGMVKGEAWWQPDEPGSPAPAVFSRLTVEGFQAGAGELGELHFRTLGPFAERGHDPWVRFGTSVKLDAGHNKASGWATTPYAAYAQALHSTGTVRRYRFFDETIDLGTTKLHPRRRQFGSPEDAAPVLDAPRSGATPGGLHLTISNRSLEDNVSLAIGMAVSVPIDVDRSSVTRGLPADMARLAQTHPVEIAIKPVSRKEDWFTAVDYDPRLREPHVVYPRYVTFNDLGKARLSTFPLRFRVRRQVLVEETPFDLTVPVVGPTHIVKYRRGMADGVF